MKSDTSGAVWGACIHHFVHPLKVAIIEAFLWVEQPLAPKLIGEMNDNGVGIGLVSYHMRSLADAGLIEIDHQRHVRGALQTFYRLVDQDG